MNQKKDNSEEEYRVKVLKEIEVIKSNLDIKQGEITYPPIYYKLKKWLEKYYRL